MEKFDSNKILLDLQTLNFKSGGHEKLETLRKNLYYSAPELLGSHFFNGWKSTMGLCAILTEYTTDEIQDEVDNRFNNIVTSFEEWKKNKDY